ncbi:MAG: polysaccharide deacetylase family protein [Deltaproteobacteria bacterium]|nr:polysaccharide deacetylase family protein [Deltaproteobacteria bacterium]
MNRTSAPRAAVNVDIDGLYLYDRIHGHQGGSGNAADFDAKTHDPRVWTLGVPRFLDLFARVGAKATFFVVAQDLENPEVRAVLADLVAAGHEVGSHSFSHPYNLSRLPIAELAEELRKARAILQDATGQAVAGFRAPGYVLSDALAEAILAAGHSYDSSRFPCPAYQGAKAGIIQLYRLRGRPSGSIAEPPSVWLGPRKPYRWTLPSGKSLIELPIGTLPGLRWPFIATSVIAGGEALRLVTRPLLLSSDWLNFECHAIDLLDNAGDQLPARLLAQPDQRVPLKAKWPVLLRTLEDLAATHDVAPLASWAERV